LEGGGGDTRARKIKNHTHNGADIIIHFQSQNSSQPCKAIWNFTIFKTFNDKLCWYWVPDTLDPFIELLDFGSVYFSCTSQYYLNTALNVQLMQM
jgi:hypothetical protein